MLILTSETKLPIRIWRCSLTDPKYMAGLDNYLTRVAKVTCASQGSYRSWKTWKVMEFRNFISRPGKSWNLIVSPRKSWRMKVLFDRLIPADEKTRTMYGGDEHKRHTFW